MTMHSSTGKGNYRFNVEENIKVLQYMQYPEFSNPQKDVIQITD